MPNRLAAETSPYLLQHKDNPVEWYPWGPEALGRAKVEDKPILVSIGYAACHWCHVMEHESFEDEATAALMNEAFVCIKVDREERPDVDGIYMSAVQAMTGHGGWPLNCFLTPDGVPFFGGTYWPPAERMGMPSFRRILASVAEAWQDRRDAVAENAAQLGEYLQRSSRSAPAPGDLTTATLDAAAAALAEDVDPQHGGFGGAPKFPQPVVIDFLLRHHRRTGDERSRGMAELTLDRMAAGGLYDHVGGGFHRYSVDAVWLVPHFEKMLYDNAQLARVYLDAARALGHDRYRRVATETLEYVAREMTSPEGGFYATQDADSEGEEGRFYVWTPAEIDAVLGADDGRVVRAYYGVTERGNFEGRNILNTPRPAATVAAELGMAEDALLATVAATRTKLYDSREQRVHPGRDEKIITAWNGLMLRAFAEGSTVLGRRDFLGLAERNADFVLTRLRTDDGRLRRTAKDGQAKLDGYLEDYAFLADGLLALYQATFDRRWVEAAISLAETMVADFADPEGDLFYDTGAHHETLVARPRDLQDGATPAGNSVAAEALLRLAALTGRDEWARRAEGILRTLANPMAEHPTAFGQFLCAADLALAGVRELTLVGSPTDTTFRDLARQVTDRYEPNLVAARFDPAEPDLADLLPLVADRPMRDGQATAYLCERGACLPPVTDPAALASLLAQGTAAAWPVS